MKYQIRRGTFETNSSSTHSITICSGEDYKKFKNGELFLKLEEGVSKLYALEEAIEKVKSYKARNWAVRDVNWDSLEAVKEEIRRWGFEAYDFVSEEDEYYEDALKNPDGTEVVAFTIYRYE